MNAMHPRQISAAFFSIALISAWLMGFASSESYCDGTTGLGFSPCFAMKCWGYTFHMPPMSLRLFDGQQLLLRPFPGPGGDGLDLDFGRLSTKHRRVFLDQHIEKVSHTEDRHLEDEDLAALGEHRGLEDEPDGVGYGHDEPGHVQADEGGGPALFHLPADYGHDGAARAEDVAEPD
jgi:hypothetical protein